MDYTEIILKTILEKYGPILTVDHLAEMLHLSPRSIRNQLYGKNALRLPHGRRIGKRQYFAADDVAQWLTDHIHGPQTGNEFTSERPTGESYSKRGRPRKTTASI